jgi:hypothetical protein
MTAREFQAARAWRVEDLVGYMSADIIRPAEVLTADNALPLSDYRRWPDLDMELVSFAASVDRLVAGQLRPGHLINVYGVNSSGNPDEAFTVLVESNVRVVDVFASGGTEAGRGQAAPDETGEGVTYENDRDRPSTLVTVALPPEKAYHLIDSLQAQRLSPYVTLAGAQTSALLATPPARLAAAKETPPVDIGATLTAITLRLPTLVPPKDGG